MRAFQSALASCGLLFAITAFSFDEAEASLRRHLTTDGIVHYLAASSSSSPKGVCVFDIDRTLTATQLGSCPNAITQRGIIDYAYGGSTALKEAAFARGALKACFRQGLAISIATRSAGCAQGIINNEKSKYVWLDQMIQEATGQPLSALGVSESQQPGSIQCGDKPKNLMIKAIQAYWKLPMSSIVFYDDIQANLDDVAKDPATESVILQLASVDRNGDDCATLSARCCGITPSELQQGLSKLGGSSGVTETPTTGAVKPLTTQTPTTTNGSTVYIPTTPLLGDSPSSEASSTTQPARDNSTSTQRTTTKAPTTVSPTNGKSSDSTTKTSRASSTVSIAYPLLTSVGFIVSGALLLV